MTGSADKIVRLWDLTTKDLSANPVVLCGHEGTVSALAISPDNRWLATAGWDKIVRLWDLTAKNPSANPLALCGHEDAVSALAISPDSHWLVTGSADKTVRLWDLTAHNPAASPVVLRGHQNRISAVEISPAPLAGNRQLRRHSATLVASVEGLNRSTLPLPGQGSVRPGDSTERSEENLNKRQPR